MTRKYCWGLWLVKMRWQEAPKKKKIKRQHKYIYSACFALHFLKHLLKWNATTVKAQQSSLRSLSLTLFLSLSLSASFASRQYEFWEKVSKKFVACLKFQSEANHRTRLLHSSFAFRISYSFVVRRGVILYRELSAAPTAAFPTNLLEINRAFSQQRVESAEAPKIYDSILGIGRSKMPPSLRQMQPKQANFASHLYLVSLS